MKRIILTALSLILFFLLLVGVTARLGWWPVRCRPSGSRSSVKLCCKLLFPIKRLA